MDKHRRLASLLSLVLVFPSLHAAVDPDVYLKFEWYDVELLVFQQPPTAAQDTSEAETLVLKKPRQYPTNAISFWLTQQEADFVFHTTDHVNFVETQGMFLRSYPANLGSLDSERDPTNDNKNPTTIQGCALHVASTEPKSREPPFNGRAELSLEAEEFRLQDDDLTVSSARDLDLPAPLATPSEQKTRDTRLPIWLPDGWQTFDSTLSDATRALLLCEEDLKAILYSGFEDERELSPIEVVSDEPEQITRWVTPAEAESRFASYEAQLLTEERTWNEKEVRLKNTNRRLRNQGYRIIGHGKWHQRIPARGQQIPMIIQLGAKRDDGLREVEGIIELSVGRFLHFNAKLWFAVDEYDQSSLVDKWHVHESKFAYYELNESRRMRSGEYNYIDHPVLGVFVRIDRKPLSDEMQYLIDELNENF